MAWAVGSGSVLGSSIETSEITDGSITPAKLATGMILVDSGSGTGTSISLTSLTARKRYILVLEFQNTSGSTSTISARVNGNTGAAYDYIWSNGGIFTLTQGGTSMKIGDLPTARDWITQLNFNSGTNQIEQIPSMMSVGVTNYMYLGGWYRGTWADVTQIDILMSASVAYSYALYYLYDFEAV